MRVMRSCLHWRGGATHGGGPARSTTAPRSNSSAGAEKKFLATFLAHLGYARQTIIFFARKREFFFGLFFRAYARKKIWCLFGCFFGCFLGVFWVFFGCFLGVFWCFLVFWGCVFCAFVFFLFVFRVSAKFWVYFFAVRKAKPRISSLCWGYFLLRAAEKRAV